MGRRFAILPSMKKVLSSPVLGKIRQKSAHIPVAFGVGRSAPSQPIPGLGAVPSAAYPQSLSAEGDQYGLSPLGFVREPGRRNVKRSTIYSGLPTKRTSHEEIYDGRHHSTGRRATMGVAVRQNVGVVRKSSRPPVHSTNLLTYFSGDACCPWANSYPLAWTS